MSLILATWSWPNQMELLQSSRKRHLPKKVLIPGVVGIGMDTLVTPITTLKMEIRCLAFGRWFLKLAMFQYRLCLKYHS